jgi:peptidoglycan LD-endopeptidase CwlK
VSSRDLTTCHLEVGRMASEAIMHCRSEGIEILVTCAFRSNDEQNSLYAQGRTAPGRIVTNARGGQSSHNYVQYGAPASLAVDIVPMRHGKPVWGLKGDGMDDDPTDDDKDDLELWQRVRAHFEAAGLKSASRWSSFKEWPHFEHPNAKQIMAGGQ